MSKVQDGVPWDAREAFHRATMAVYANLEALIDILKREPNLRVALIALDRIVEHRSPERGDTKLIANLKHAVGHLLESLTTVEDVRKNHPSVGSAFWRGRGIDRTWSAIASGSYHGVTFGAAQAMLEPDTAGAAQLGRKAPAGCASGVIRQKVIEAAIEPESWARLAENLEHEYRSASLLPHSPIGEPKPAAGPIEEVQLEHSEGGNLEDAMERYSRSCDEMRTVRLNPRKVIPVDQWPEETQLRGSAIVRVQDCKRYARYVLSVAAKNERDARQARLWWEWWETTQVEPSKALPAPLVSPRIEAALRMAAAQRRAESPRQAAGGVETQPSSPDKPKRQRGDRQQRPKPEVIDATAKKCLQDALKAAQDAGEAYVPRRADIAKTVSKSLNYTIGVASLFGTRQDRGARKHRYPDFIKLWQETQRLSRASRPRKPSGRHG